MSWPSWRCVPEETCCFVFAFFCLVMFTTSALLFVLSCVLPKYLLLVKILWAWRSEGTTGERSARRWFAACTLEESKRKQSRKGKREGKRENIRLSV